MRPLALALLVCPAAARAAHIPVQARFAADWFQPAQLPGLGDSVTVVRPTQDVPDETVDLGEVFNKNWKADSYETPAGRVWLGTHFDLRGGAFLSVVLPHGMVATFYKYEAGMRGSWQAGGETYDLSLDVSIFRSRTSNYVVVKRRSDGAVVYKRRIRELLLRTYPLGRRIVVRGREYRLFFSHGVLAGKPARTDPNSYCVVLVTNVGTDDDLDYRTYILPFKDLEGGGLVTYQLYDGHRVRLRARKDQAELEIYLP